jgi:hypothetical protein
MARPVKEGLDYFPLDTDIDQDDKVVIIIAKYGMQGFGILIKLLMGIYKNGYSYQWTEKEQIIFSSRVNVDINLINDVVNDCIKWGLFHEGIYKEYGVLTSKGIQNRYLLAASRRVNIGINENINLVSVDINTKSIEKQSEESTQKKGNKTKIKETKTKKIKTIDKIQHAEFVSLKEDEYQKLIAEHGEEKVKQMIQVLDNYKGAKGVNYKSDYRAILNWVVERVGQASNKPYGGNYQNRTGGKNNSGKNNDAEVWAKENGIPF